MKIVRYNESPYNLGDSPFRENSLPWVFYQKLAPSWVLPHFSWHHWYFWLSLNQKLAIAIHINHWPFDWFSNWLRSREKCRWAGSIHRWFRPQDTDWSLFHNLDQRSSLKIFRILNLKVKKIIDPLLKIKEVILEILQIYIVCGKIGKIFPYLIRELFIFRKKNSKKQLGNFRAFHSTRQIFLNVKKFFWLWAMSF